MFSSVQFSSVADNVTIPQIIKCISYEKEYYFTQPQNTHLYQEFNTDTFSWIYFSLSPLLFSSLLSLVISKASSDQIRSVAQSCPTLCDPMNCSTPGLPVHHQLPEFTQTHVHRVSDAIQPSHPLSSPSPPAPNPSQHQSLFQWVNSSHEVAKVLEFQL